MVSMDCIRYSIPLPYKFIKTYDKKYKQGFYSDTDLEEKESVVKKRSRQKAIAEINEELSNIQSEQIKFNKDEY